MRVSLTDAARQVALELSQQAVARRIGLAFEEEGDVGIEANALLLHELMVNLLDNAIRYTPIGGQVTLRVRAMRRPGQPTAALLEVEDNGPGARDCRHAQGQRHAGCPGARQRAGGAHRLSGRRRAARLIRRSCAPDKES
ncbi:sensor histidine kinase [Herbaspirillum huttiense]|uniref:sensor histidine kinase n=1 Tax=Herbaspirillum huttiense TaxID=863372 RepID=UPI0003F5F155|nr:ATP-binding protein [Herbaspirillum huttiense]